MRSPYSLGSLTWMKALKKYPIRKKIIATRDDYVDNGSIIAAARAPFVWLDIQLLFVVNCESSTLNSNARISFQDTSIYWEKYCLYYIILILLHNFIFGLPTCTV